jgi:hypothetical protein
MGNENRRFMMMHGSIVAFIGALSGLVYTLVISGDLPGSIRAWHIAHLQGVMTGILIIAASSAVPHLQLDLKKCRAMAIFFVITGYCYAIGPVWGAVFGVRGIAPTGPATNVLMFISNTVASISVLIGLGFAIHGARKT